MNCEALEPVCHLTIRLPLPVYGGWAWAVSGHNLCNAFRGKLTNKLIVCVMDSAMVEEELEPEILRRWGQEEEGEVGERCTFEESRETKMRRNGQRAREPVEVKSYRSQI